jgi:hypothetical protein
MTPLVLSVDRASEWNIEARIKITAEPKPAAGLAVKLTTTYGGITTTHTGATHMAYTLPADKVVQLQIAYVDANGNPASVDGAVTWDSSDDEIATWEPISPLPPGTPEGGAIMLVPGTKIGNCQISAHADADLGGGVRELVTLLDVTVVGGEAVAGTITPVGEPMPKP